MRGESNCGAVSLALGEHGLDEFAMFGIQMALRLIQEQDFRRSNQCEREREELILAGGKLMRKPLSQMINLHGLDLVGYVAFAVRLSPPPGSQDQTKVLFHREISRDRRQIDESGNQCAEGRIGFIDLSSIDCDGPARGLD